MINRLFRLLGVSLLNPLRFFFCVLSVVLVIGVFGLWGISTLSILIFISVVIWLFLIWSPAAFEIFFAYEPYRRFFSLCFMAILLCFSFGIYLQSSLAITNIRIPIDEEVQINEDELPSIDLLIPSKIQPGKSTSLRLVVSVPTPIQPQEVNIKISSADSFISVNDSTYFSDSAQFWPASSKVESRFDQIRPELIFNTPIPTPTFIPTATLIPTSTSTPVPTPECAMDQTPTPEVSSLICEPTNTPSPEPTPQFSEVLIPSPQPEPTITPTSQPTETHHSTSWNNISLHFYRPCNSSLIDVWGEDCELGFRPFWRSLGDNLACLRVLQQDACYEEAVLTVQVTIKNLGLENRDEEPIILVEDVAIKKDVNFAQELVLLFTGTGFLWLLFRNFGKQLLGFFRGILEMSTSRT